MVVFLKLKLTKSPEYPRVKSETQWINIYHTYSQEFDSLAVKFLSENDFSAIHFQEKYNRTSCGAKSVSTCYPYSAEKNIYTNGRLIDPDNDYTTFMKKLNIMFLDKYSSGVEFSSADFGKCGLKYFSHPTDFTPDHEYVKITKIADNWYYFCQDWN